MEPGYFSQRDTEQLRHVYGRPVRDLQAEGGRYEPTERDSREDGFRDPKSTPTAGGAGAGGLGKWGWQAPGELTYSQNYVDSLHKRFEQRLREKDGKIDFLKREMACKDEKVSFVLIQIAELEKRLSTKTHSECTLKKQVEEIERDYSKYV